MKTRALFLLPAILLIMTPAASTAQVGGLLKNKLNKVINAGTKTVNKEVNKEIDTAVNKEVVKARDKQIEDAKNRADQEGTDQNAGQAKKEGKGFNLGGLMGGKVTSKYNESYSFNSRIYMQMEMYDKKDVTKMDYYIYFSESTPTAGFESKMLAKSDDGEQVTVTSSYVFDGENKSFIIMTDMGTMKVGIISEVPDETATQGQQVDKTQNGTITKTGNSKEIAGYKCDEYLYKDNESKNYGKLWVTKDLKLKADKRTFSKVGLPAYYGNADLEGGAVLAMESYNEKDVLEMKSETKEINMNFPHTISVAGYTLRQMNFGQAGGQNKK